VRQVIWRAGVLTANAALRAVRRAGYIIRGTTCGGARCPSVGTNTKRQSGFARFVTPKLMGRSDPPHMQTGIRSRRTVAGAPDLHMQTAGLTFELLGFLRPLGFFLGHQDSPTHHMKDSQEPRIKIVLAVA
jgi:hypothetical protein